MVHSWQHQNQSLAILLAFDLRLYNINVNIILLYTPHEFKNLLHKYSENKTAFPHVTL